jgi:hypothetical protein
MYDKTSVDSTTWRPQLLKCLICRQDLTILWVRINQLEELSKLSHGTKPVAEQSQQQPLMPHILISVMPSEIEVTSVQSSLLV